MLRGDLDMASRSVLRTAGAAQLATPGLVELTLDLSDLTFLDSSGVGALVELRNQANEYGVGINLVAVPPRAARVLTIGGLAGTFGIPPASDPSDESPAED